VDVGEPQDPDRRRPIETASADPPAGLIEQYKLAVEMADRVSARRGSANGFFLTVQTTLVALLAVPGIQQAWIASAGIILAGAWWLLLRSYRELASAKWAAIEKLERCLPAQPFIDEWELLKKDPVKWWRPRYAELGFAERLVPVVFAAIFIVTLSAG